MDHLYDADDSEVEAQRELVEDLYGVDLRTSNVPIPAPCWSWSTAATE